MAAWILLACLYQGVCVEAPDAAMQQRLFDDLQHNEWGKDAQHRNTCRNALFSSCPPVIYDARLDEAGPGLRDPSTGLSRGL